MEKQIAQSGLFISQIDMATTEVNATREFAKILSQAKVDYVDAPVSGGEIGAKEATLSIMVGLEIRVLTE